MQFRVGAIPRLPKFSFKVTKGQRFNIGCNLIMLILIQLRIMTFLWTTYLLMDNYYPCFSGEEGQVQSPSRPTPPPYRSSNGFQGDAPPGNIFR